jgi:hypothetical protein
MKHIKTLNELLKSTYLSAARGLGQTHGKRSKELIDWATKSGQDVEQDRIYPHRFLFDESFENEYYFITGYSSSVESSGSSGERFLKFNIHMNSNWDKKTDFTLIFKILTTEKYRIDKNRLDFYPHRSTSFNNEDSKIARQNANHLLKFFKECWEDDLSKVDYKGFEIKGLSVNKLYKSES